MGPVDFRNAARQALLGRAIKRYQIGRAVNTNVSDKKPSGS